MGCVTPIDKRQIAHYLVHHFGISSQKTRLNFDTLPITCIDYISSRLLRFQKQKPTLGILNLTNT